MRQGWRVVDAVANHADLQALPLQFLDLLGLLPWQDIGQDDVNAEHVRDAFGGAGIVTCEHRHANALLVQFGDRCDGCRARRIGDCNEPEQPTRACHMDDGAAFALERFGLVTERQKIDLLLVHEAPVAKENRRSGDRGTGALAFDVQEVRDFGKLQVLGSLDDGNGQRVIRPLIHGSCDLQNLVGRNAGGGDNFDDLGLAHRERAGLVEDDHVELGRLLESSGILEQNAI